MTPKGMPWSGPRYLPAAISVAFRLVERQVPGQGDHAPEPRIEAVHAREVDARQALGGERAGLDPVRQRGDGRESDVLVACGSGPAALGGRTGRSRGRADARDHRVPERRRRERLLEGELAGTGPPLHGRGQRARPARGDLRLLGRRVLDASEFLGFGDGRGSDLGPRAAPSRTRAAARAGRRSAGGSGLLTGTARLAAAAPTTPAVARTRNFRRDSRMDLPPLLGVILCRRSRS